MTMSRGDVVGRCKMARAEGRALWLEEVAPARGIGEPRKV